MRNTEQQQEQPRWAQTLRALMEVGGLNPRSLSLKAGLNPTAVRDMLEGRVKFPRYDTVESLAAALGVTPAQLMSGNAEELIAAGAGKTSLTETASRLTDPLADEDLNLLTEIIARLQETAEEYRQQLAPRDFAAMVTTIYSQMKPEKAPEKKDALSALTPKIKDLLAYETLRRKIGAK